MGTQNDARTLVNRVVEAAFRVAKAEQDLAQAQDRLEEKQGKAARTHVALQTAKQNLLDFIDTFKEG